MYWFGFRSRRFDVCACECGIKSEFKYVHTFLSFNGFIQLPGSALVSVCLQKFPWLRDHATMKRTKQGLILSMNKNKANFTNDSLAGTFAFTFKATFCTHTSRQQCAIAIRTKFIVCHVCRRRYVGHTDPSLPSSVPNQLPFTFVRMHNVFVRFRESSYVDHAK